MDKTDVVDVVDSESRVKTRHRVKRGERTRGEERLSSPPRTPQATRL